MLTFAFVGRLTPEKGFDTILNTWEILRTQHPEIYTDIRLFIFGDGPLRSSIPEYFHYCESSLYGYKPQKDQQNSYFGMRETKEIWDFLSQYADYTLMPSRFLETFGLVALESLSARVPVIGFQKGGLIPFIHDTLALREHDEAESCVQIIEKIVSSPPDRDEILGSIDLTPYSLETWRENLFTFLETDLGSADRILLVNDYTARIGGAETYTYFLKEELERLGKVVFLTGYDRPIGSLGRIWRMVTAPLALLRGSHITRVIDRFHPDLIWCQSVLRYVGPWGMRALTKSGVSIAITHHDLGLFTPRPSRVFSEGDIPTDTSLGEFVRAMKGGNIITLLATFFKWWYIRWIFSYVKRIPFHFVPSSFMVRHLEHHDIRSDRVRVFPHTKI